MGLYEEIMTKTPDSMEAKAHVVDAMARALQLAEEYANTDPREISIHQSYNLLSMINHIRQLLKH